MSNISKAVDIFSRFVSLQPLKNKTPSKVTKAIKIIFEQGKKPKLLHTDKEKEFSASVIEKYFKKIGVHHFVTQKEGKAKKPIVKSRLLRILFIII